MRKNRAITMISLVITIALIIIIATITSVYLSSTLDDVQYKDMKEELKNVENVVEYAKTQILIDEFMPNESWMITDAELDNKFGKILSTDEKNHIKAVNASSSIKAPYKYYLMNQTRFDSEFGNDYNVSNLRPAREYLVNYMDTFVACNYGGTRVANAENVNPGAELERGEVAVKYTPDGNMEWARQQATMISVESSAGLVINDMKYLWTQSYTEPADSEFVSSLSNNQTINLDKKTGNDWYAWVYVSYTEDGVAKKYKTRSNPFYIDNTPPDAILDVDEIHK